MILLPIPWFVMYSSLMGQIREYDANVIAANMYDKVYPNGRSRSNLYSIVEYCGYDTTIEREAMHITTKSGQKRLRMTT